MTLQVAAIELVVEWILGGWAEDNGPAMADELAHTMKDRLRTVDNSNRWRGTLDHEQ